MTRHGWTAVVTTSVAMAIFVGTAVGLLAKEVIRERAHNELVAFKWLSALNWLLYPLLILCLELAVLRILLLT